MPKKQINNVKKGKKINNYDKKGKADNIKKNINNNIEKKKKLNNINNISKQKIKSNDYINNRKTNLKKIENNKFLQEYYDLPYRYNETIVTILAQTPKRLFVYWDVSDKDKETYRKAFGDDFFEKTYPVLLVHNEELNYTFEIPINDFANSWYFDIKDSKTKYVVQLGRKFRHIEELRDVDYNTLKKENINLQNDYIYITDSNKLEAPNDHILFELIPNKIKYRNVKNGNEFSKDLKDIVKDLKENYSENVVHNLYTKLYSDEIEKDASVINNPSSNELGLPSSSSNIKTFV